MIEDDLCTVCDGPERLPATTVFGIEMKPGNLAAILFFIPKDRATLEGLRDFICWDCQRWVARFLGIAA